MNFKTKAFVLCGLTLFNVSYLGLVLAQQIKENDKDDEEGKLDNSTLFCIVVVVLVVLAKLFFCACCCGDCNGSRRREPDENDIRRL